MKNHTPRNPCELRRQAEAHARQRAARTPADSETLSPEEIRKTIHELRVHQIELEMQNEELRTAHARIEAGRARYFDLYDLAPVGYCTLSEKGLILEANLTAAALLGTTRGELIEQPISRFILKEDQDIYYLHRKNLFETGEPQECDLRLVRPDGTPFWARLDATAANDEAGAPTCRVAISDTSEQKRAEASKSEHQGLLEAIYRNAPLIMMVVDGERRVRQINGFAAQFAERPTGEMLGLRGGEALRCLHALDDPRGCGFGAFCSRCVIRNTVLDTLESGRTNLQVEADYYPEPGDGRTPEMKLLVSSTPLDFKGERMALVTMLDITERKRAEEALSRSQRELQAIYDSAPVMLCVVDEARRVRYANPAFTAFTGLDEATLLGGVACGVLGCVTARESTGGCGCGEHCADCALLHALNDTLRTGAGHSGIERRLTLERAGRREEVSLLGATAAIPGAHGRNALLCLADMTEQRALAAQLSQAQKMESVGRLAGGVAHDFNNMLSIILGNTELAMENTAPDDPRHDNLSEIFSAAKRSAAITRQLLAFARKQTIAPTVLDLNRTIKSMLKMLRRLIGEDIDLAWRPERKVWPVRMDPSQIDQILANLCVNARDAIADVGRITIETGTATFDSAYCAEHPGFVAGDFVLLAVSDNGCGMGQETLASLFEPFFTTKDVDKGTGLGLATVYGIVKQNDGFINVYSEPGHGTTFRIYLPRYLAEAQSPEKKTSDKPNLVGTETILLVEDEPSILKMTRMMLERTGYTVLAAGTPGEAIALARGHLSACGDAQAGAGEIHLLMTDVVMPEMNGRDLAEKLLSLYPNLKRLFMSGYTANVIAHHGILDEGVQYIQKPFSKQDLAIKVREVLDADNL